MWRTKKSEDNKSIKFYDRTLEKFKNDGIQKPGRFTGSIQAGDYIIYAVNIHPDDFGGLSDKIGKLPPTMI